jgi:hypothetical protein
VAAADGFKIVRATPEGLLVLTLDRSGLGHAQDAAADAEGNKRIRLADGRVELLYCPPLLLDPATGLPGPGCFTDPATLAPGPEALVGVGRADGDIVLDAMLALGCPSSWFVTGSVATPAGERFDIEDQLVLSPSERGAARREASRSVADCVAAHERFDVDFARIREGASINDRAQLDERDLMLVGTLLRVEPADLELLRKIVSLAPEQAEQLDLLLRTDGAAGLERDGRVTPIKEIAPGGDAEVVQAAGIQDLINQVLSRINAVVVPRLNTILGRLPDRADIRGLLAELPATGSITRALEQTRETFEGVLAIVEDLRDGFDAWEGTGCGATTGCGQFKASISSLLADMREATQLIQGLSCVNRPGLAVRPLRTDFIEELINEKTPHVVLFGLHKTLDRIEPDWRMSIRSILDEIPPDSRQDLVDQCGAAGDGALAPDAAAKASVASSQAVCKLLRPRGMGNFLTAARAVAKRKGIVVKVIDNLLKDNINAVIGAVAVGGATVGIDIKNPPKVTTEMLKEFADALPDNIKDVIDKRDQCLEADDDIESDLLACDPRATYFIQDLPGAELVPLPRFADAYYLVELRKEQIEDCQSAGACDELDPDTAGTYLESAADNEGTPEGFRMLCCAYDALVGREACESLASSVGRSRSSPLRP